MFHRQYSYIVSSFLLLKQNQISKSYSPLTSPSYVFENANDLASLGIPTLRQEGLLAYYFSVSQLSPLSAKYSGVTPSELLLANPNSGLAVLKSAKFTSRNIASDSGINDLFKSGALLSELLKVYTPAEVATAYTNSDFKKLGVVNEDILTKIGDASLFGPSPLTEVELSYIRSILNSNIN